jgi:hypothetical protein
VSLSQSESKQSQYAFLSLKEEMAENEAKLKRQLKELES